MFVGWLFLPTMCRHNEGSRAAEKGVQMLLPSQVISFLWGRLLYTCCICWLMSKTSQRRLVFSSHKENFLDGHVILQKKPPFLLWTAIKVQISRMALVTDRYSLVFGEVRHF